MSFIVAKRTVSVLVMWILLLERAAALSSFSFSPGMEDCWSGLEARRSACCEGGSNRLCFDEVFTKAECCSDGWAWRFPLPLPEPSNFSESFQWFQGLATAHPALHERQLRWEELMERASRMMHQKINGHDIDIHYFKTAADVTGNELADYSHGSDPYAMRHLRTSAAPVFLDIGANMGLVSIALAKLWPKAKVLAVEPAPATFRYLLWNLKENQVLHQVWPLNLAVSSSPAPIRMSYASAGSVWTARVRDASVAGNDGNDYLFDAPVASLAEILASLGLGPIDLLKVDCEGCEWEILAKWDLLSHLFQHVSVELHNGSFVEPVGISETDRQILEAKFLQSELCRTRQEEPGGQKCRSY